LPGYQRRPRDAVTGPCGLFTGTRYGADQFIPPSAERSIHVPSNALRCSGVDRAFTARQRFSRSGAQSFAAAKGASYANDVNVDTSNDPCAVSSTPASRSSMTVSISTSGQLHVSPSSRERINSTRPNGQTCASRPPE
jgi:hypothetical protein